MNSEEYAEYLELEFQALKEYKQKAKEYFESLETDNQLLLFFHITNVIFKNYFKDNCSYRGLLYDKFGKNRVDRELDKFLDLDFFPRVGGGIGITRLLHAMNEYTIRQIVANM